MNFRSSFRPLLLLALLLVPVPSPACLWIYGTRLDGSEVEMNGESMADAVGMEMNMLTGEPGWHQQVLEDSVGWAQDLADTNDYTIRNNYAVTLLRLGHFTEALSIFQGIEREIPGLYETASNIGTTYELLGRNDSALHWIKEGMRRNPESHKGTEWLHVRILEARMAMRGNPEWLRHNTVLGLDFGDGAVPVTPRIPAGYPEPDAGNLKLALYYQLKERLRLTGAPDPLTADLLVDLGNTMVLGGDALQVVVEVYSLALKYGAPHPELLGRRIAELNRIIGEYPPSRHHGDRQIRKSISLLAYGGGAALLLGAGVILLVRHRRRKRAMSA